MISHIIDLLVDFFTNLNARKILGGILLFIGLTIIGRMGISGDPDRAVLYALVGLVIGGTGAVIIYYDIARDKISHGYEETATLTKAYRQQNRDAAKPTAWHMEEKPDQHNNS